MPVSKIEICKHKIVTYQLEFIQKLLGRCKGSLLSSLFKKRQIHRVSNKTSVIKVSQLINWVIETLGGVKIFQFFDGDANGVVELGAFIFFIAKRLLEHILAYRTGGLIETQLQVGQIKGSN